MPRQNRRDIFDPNEVGCFHAVQRTVRRAWLFGNVLGSRRPLGAADADELRATRRLVDIA
ncbi:MAG: hypothetical protein NTU79_17120 [Planctomycetota bacterium]|nr:hypothetical protein [Planctomycetota bacterium]